jgi:hypothetical protein
MAKVVECLPGKWKAQSLNPSTSKKKKKKKEEKERKDGACIHFSI